MKTGVKTLTLSLLAGLLLAAPAFCADTERVVEAKGHKMIVDTVNHELRLSAEVTRNDSKAGVGDWGKRGAAWFGCGEGNKKDFFIFTTGIDRPALQQGLTDIGLVSRRQITAEEAKARTGLKGETKVEDYQDGDPLIIAIRFEKDGKLVQRAIEDFIQEKIYVQGKDVIKPYTPHWIFHGTGEKTNSGTGCVSCPEDCYGGIIADNSVPVLSLESYYKVNWDLMPPVGSKVEVVIKSIYGPNPLSSLK